MHYIEKHGHGNWRALPKLAGLNRCGNSCMRLWTNYLRPDIKRGQFSQEEEQTILNLHAIHGNKWSAIATHLPGRTDIEIKNFWNNSSDPQKHSKNNATIQELSAFTVLNINTSVSGNLETTLPPPPPSSLVTENLHDSTVFSRLPGGEDCFDFTAVLSHRENSASSAWMQETCIASMGDECSYGGGAQIWSELLDDPIFRDIA